MKYSIDKKKRPVYLQIYRQLRQDIIDGIYPRGKKLPSMRLLCDELSVSTVTVDHAYALLCDEGYIESRERSGFFVIFEKADGFAAPAEARTAHSHAPEVYHTYPAFPFSILSKTMRKVLSDYADVLHERSPNAGCEELREAIKSYLIRNRGMNVESSQIVIGSGAEYLYGLIITMLGRRRTYGIESPSYEKIEQIYNASDVRYELLPLCHDGIDSSALSKTKANVIHTTPYRSFPTGITASANKRHEYIRWASKKERIIIEDDFESEFSVSSKPEDTLYSLSNYDNVIYMNSFSKTVSPALRVGYMVLPKRLVSEFEEKLGFYSCTVPTFEQFVLAELINSGDFERHINRVRRNLRKKL
ncbi:MAG: PLP-dependent aminotransferase family protein [Clostridia bacterium]|nr:PLP-dependent aminotransferase family protein [Clostridia bacterium]MBR3806437.1 PLP-dependent aminotransferase family protein [Clostridia bacterium]